ncbi:hypothetical protein DEO72_LG3g710 [Vigna unguiculata]|uniref:Uncharacterized protein n=1 Tax=Vigna unguiculata TaxID=3917 RepID=A0A4D6LCA5_VIGUN|nr:hypothetical protein DEO72_LG3g710 [Vigna unguiculata]
MEACFSTTIAPHHDSATIFLHSRPSQNLAPPSSSRSNDGNWRATIFCNARANQRRDALHPRSVPRSSSAPLHLANASAPTSFTVASPPSRRKTQEENQQQHPP